MAERAIVLSPRLVVGLTIILVGLLLTLDNLDYLNADRWLAFWPLALIVVGLLKLRGGSSKDLVVGGLWVGFGLWFLADNLGWVRSGPFDFLLPILLLLLGVKLVTGGLDSRRSAEVATAGSTVSSFGFLGAEQKRSNSPAFRGGDLTAVMGGCGLDLTSATLAAEGAKIEVFAFWGGVEIRVPSDWWVETRVQALLGGLDDRAEQQPATGGPRLEITGWAIMGGVEIRN